MSDIDLQSSYFSGRRVAMKFACLVLAASLTTALVTGVAALYSVYAPLRAQNRQILSAALASSGERIREQLDRAQADVAAIARAPWLLDATRAESARGAEPETPDSGLGDVLEKVLARKPGLEGLLVLDASGSVLAAVGVGTAMDAALDALRLRDATQGSELIEVMEAKQLRRELANVKGTSIRALAPGAAARVVVIASAMQDAEGRAFAALLGLVQQRELASRLGADWLGESGDVLLVDAQGRLIAAGRGLPPTNSAGIAEEISAGSDVCSPRFDWTTGSGGVVVCSRSLGALGWWLVAQQSVHEAFRPVVVLVPIVVAAAIGVTLALSALAFWIVAVVLRPLTELHRGIVAVARGDYSECVSERGALDDARAMLDAFNRLVRRLRDQSEKFESSERALKVQNESFQQKYQAVSEISITDPLTRIYNRRYFDEYLDSEINRLGREGDGLCLLVIDIDDFKMLNDNFGHAAGDEFLKQISRIMRENVRETDLLARFGGEEFVVVANGASLEGASILAEKIRTRVAESSFIVDDSMRPRRATVSIGVAAYRGSRSDLFTSADTALYRAKDSGKNCVVTAGAESGRVV